MVDLSRAQHDAVLSTYARPEWLVATMAPDTSTLNRVHPDLRHDYWTICTDDPSKRIDAEVHIDFNVVVDVGSMLLTQGSDLGDLLTAKITIIESLRGQYISRRGASSIPGIFQAFTWIVRWRRGLSIRRMDRVTKEIFEDYCSALKNAGCAGLVPLDDRIRLTERAVREGKYKWPLQISKSSGDLVSMKRVMSDLGIPVAIPARNARIKLAEAIERTSGKSSPSLRTPSERGCEEVRPTVNFAADHMVGWNRLYLLSSIGLLPHDPLRFDPFGDLPVMAWARRIGVHRTSRTRTVEPQHWIELLDAAAFWVLELSGPLLRIIEIAKDKHVELRSVLPEAELRRTEKLKNAPRRAWANAVSVAIESQWPNQDKGRWVPSLAAAWRSGDLQGSGDLPLETALSYLVTACVILIGGFSARRKTELMSLRAGCARQDPFGAWWLSSYIEKTIRDIDDLPVPASVGIAARILEAISEPTRYRTGKAWLLRIDRPIASSEHDDGNMIHVELTSKINDFATVMRLSSVATDDGGRFAAHQLRRAFAIYYYYGYRGASLDALSRFLRHFDPEMTRVYITEAVSGSMMRLSETIKARSMAWKEMQQTMAAAPQDEHAEDAMKAMRLRATDFEDVRQEAFVDRSLEVYDGFEAPIGQGAGRIYDDLEEMIEQARKKVQISGRSNIPPGEEREALVDVLRRLAPRRYIEPHPGRHANCTCMHGVDEDLAAATCLRNKADETGRTGDRRPDYAFASAQDCLECPHFCGFSENIVVLGHLIQDTAVATEKAPSEDMRVAARGKLEALKAGIARGKMAVEGRQG